MLHFRHAGAVLEAARWGDRAAGWAIARDFPEAERQAHRALRLAADADASVERDRVELQARARVVQLSWRVIQDDEAANANFEAARTLAELLGDDSALATLLANHALLISSEQEPILAPPYLEQAI